MDLNTSTFYCLKNVHEYELEMFRICKSTEDCEKEKGSISADEHI